MKVLCMLPLLLVLASCTTTTNADDCTNEHVACPEILSPVCGSDGRTYDNDCLLEAAKCTNASLTLQHVGDCKTSACKDTMCLQVYLPVCGSNGKTYSNECAFNNAKCRDRSLTIVNTGPCEKTDSMEFYPTCGDLRCPKHTKCVKEPNLVPYCADVCDKGRCRPNEICKLQQVQCIRAPCPPIAVCLPKESNEAD